MTREQLAKRIADVSLLRGEFTLRSGRKSNYYLDKYRFETQPDVLAALGKLFAEHVTPKTQRIAGAELGAVPLAAAASMASGLPCVLVRNQKKDYGTSKQVEGILESGETVMIVEDVLTTGGQVIEVCKTIEALGARVEKIVGVIDRLEGARENIEKAGYAFESLFTTADLGVKERAMTEHTIELRVRYPEVDAMGYLHHSRYLQYFELGRVELLRAMGRAYADLERDGVFFVVVKAEVRYRAPARYDEVLTLITHVAKRTAVRFDHVYTLNRGDVLIAEGSTTIACVDRSGELRPIPDDLAGTSPSIPRS